MVKMVNPQKLLYITTQRLGPSPSANGIVGLHGRLVIDGDVKETFSWNIRPFDSDLISEKSLAILRLQKDELMGFKSPESVNHEFVSMIEKYVNRHNRTDKLHMVGYNLVTMEIPFIREFLQKNDNYSFAAYFWFPGFDLLTLSDFYFRACREKLPNMKLQSIASFLDIPVDTSNIYDMNYKIDLYQKVFEALEERAPSFKF